MQYRIARGEPGALQEARLRSRARFRADRLDRRATPTRSPFIPSLPATTIAEFIALAKAHPGKLNYASAGIGTSPQLSMELFRMTGRHRHRPRPVQGRRAGAGGPDRRDEVEAMFSTVPSVLGAAARRQGPRARRHVVRRATPICRTCRPSPSRACRASRSSRGKACALLPVCPGRHWSEYAPVPAWADRQACTGLPRSDFEARRCPMWAIVGASCRSAPRLLQFDAHILDRLGPLGPLGA